MDITKRKSSTIKRLLKAIVIAGPVPVLIAAGVFCTTIAMFSMGHYTTLAIASDVIECAKPNWLQKYSTITITETASDSLNDNPNGLPMDVFSLKASQIIFHNYEDKHLNFELLLSDTGPNRFLLPYNYYNRPWYMWTGSNISLTFNLNYTEKPTVASAYLFKGEDAINSFLRDMEKVPVHEEVVDIFSVGRSSVFWQVKHNDYYYVAVHVNGEKNTLFQCNVTFNFKYIDTSDYLWLPASAKHVGGVDDTVTLEHSLLSPNSNRTLCFMHPLDPTILESPSIHLDVSYNTDLKLRVPLIATPYVLALLYIISVIVFMCRFTLCQCLYSRRNHGSYKPIN